MPPPSMNFANTEKYKLYRFIETYPHPLYTCPPDLRGCTNIQLYCKLIVCLAQSKHDKIDKHWYVLLCFEPRQKGDFTKGMSQFDACHIILINFS